MDQYEMIRTGCRVYGKNISEMSRMTGHSRNTIKKAIRGEPWGYKERAHQPFPVLDKFLTVIDGWLKGDKDRQKTAACETEETHSKVSHALSNNEGVR